MVCGDYDLCDNCNSAGIHEHQMLKIEHPADALSVQSTVSFHDRRRVSSGLIRGTDHERRNGHGPAGFQGLFEE
jgi:hypothetical protein